MNNNIKPVKFEYIQIPELRFIGIDAWRTKEDWGDMWLRKAEILKPLDDLSEHLYRDMPYVCAFMHHDDGEVDVINRMLIGRFFDAEAYVPNGYDYRDLSPQTVAYAVFENVTADTLWQRYEVTRNTILAEGITIPYPVGYWHAEVYYDKTPLVKENDPPFNCGVLFATNKDKK